LKGLFVAVFVVLRARAWASGGVSADWSRQVTAQAEADEYRPEPLRDGQGLRFFNRRNRLAGQWKAEGLRIQSPDACRWSVSLRLASWGRAGTKRATRPLEPMDAGDRVEYRHSGLVEWYKNSPEGLEQGFTIGRKPAGAGRVELSIRLDQIRGLQQRQTEAGVEFHGADGASILQYSGLKVEDACGTRIGATCRLRGRDLVLAYQDEGAIYPVTIDPTFGAGASWSAIGEGSGSDGYANVAGVGDVNGDTYADILVAAPGYSNGRGKVYLYEGSAAGLLTYTAWTATGENDGDHFGDAISAAGDVDHDGYADEAIASPGFASATGKVYVFKGGPSGLSASPAWTKVGENTGDAFGLSLAGGYDTDGDNFSDILVGAPHFNSTQGKAYLFRGSNTGLLSTAGWTSVGPANSLFGECLAFVSSPYGDGHPGVLVGGYYYNNDQGRAYFYRGTATGPSISLDWSATGANNTFFGENVASAGDVNGDGYADVLVASSGSSGSGNGNGEVFLYLGGPAGLSTTPSQTFNGAYANGNFGTGLVGVGDINGDGYGDVLIGEEGFGSGQGKAYLFYGSATGLQATPAWQVSGEVAADGFGYYLAAAGDVNKDGYPDILVGAAGNDPNGKVYAYYGSAAGLPVPPSPTSTPTVTATPLASITPTWTISPTATPLPPGLQGLSSGSYVFPEPARGDTATLALVLPESGLATFTIFNSAAAPVARLEDQRAAGPQAWTFHVGSYAPGVYYYRVLLKGDSGAYSSLPTGKFRVLR
jgi:hypothetical protein